MNSTNTIATMKCLSVTTVLTVALFLTACVAPAAAPTATPVPPTATPIPPTATSVPPESTAVPGEEQVEIAKPVYAERGPYAVGVRNFEIEPEGKKERILTTTVWYPALNPDGLPEEYIYPMDVEAGPAPTFSVFGHAIEDAPPATDDGPYPLVVHTHALYSFRHESPFLAEQLASHGFVVIASDHEDNWSILFGSKPWQSEFRRPDEVRRQIDFAEGLSDAAGPLEGMINTELVGVSGWSYGGKTALLAGGARLNLDDFRSWCGDNIVDGEFPDPDCVDILDHEQDLATLAGLDDVPEGLWPDWGDERVSAVIAMAPPTDKLISPSLDSLDAAVMLMVGSGETSHDPQYGVANPYESIGADHKVEIVFDGAEHFLFFSTCEDAPEVVDMGFDAFCADPVWDQAQAHEHINHFATAFLLAELTDDAEAAATLASEAVDFEGIEYQSEGYDAATSAAPEAPEIISGYADNDGVQIHYEVEGEGPPLMIVNWWTGSMEDWRMFGYVDGLKEDYQLILVDMRGHGQSDKPHEPGSYDPEIVVSDIIAVLDDLDIDKTHYFGHSLSGTLGWALAKYAPERFHSFILSGEGPSSKDASANADYLRSMTADEWARNFEEATKAYGVWTPEIYDNYAGIDVDATALALTELNQVDVQPDLEDIQVPFLLIGVPTDEDYDSVLTAADRLPNVELYVSEQDHYGTGLLSDLVLPHITEFLEEVNQE